MPQDRVQKYEQRYQQKQAQQYLRTTQQNQNLSTNEWFIPKLTNSSQLFMFALLTSAALIALTPTAAESKKVKTKAPVFDQETPPSVARKTAIAATAIVTPFSTHTVQFLVKPSIKLKPQATIRPNSAKERLKIKRLIQSKTALDIALDEKDGQLQQQCLKKMQLVIKAEASLSKNNHMIKVLSQENFRIVCTTQKNFLKYAPITEGVLSGIFIHGNKQNYVVLPIDSESVTNVDEQIITLRHEFWHARHHQLHQQKSCETINSLSTTPIFPVTADNMQRYHQALDKGDERIKQFAQLRWRNIKNIALTPAQKTLLAGYQEACQGVLLVPIFHEITQDLVVNIAKKYPDYASGLFSIDAEIEGIGIIKIMKFSKYLNKYLTQIQPMNGQQMLILLPDYIKLALSHTFNDKGAEIQLCERDAYLRQGIPDHTFKTFYPEAYEIQQQYEANCDPAYRKSAP